MIAEAGAVTDLTLIRRQFYERHRLVLFKICSTGLPVRRNGLEEIRHQIFADFLFYLGLDRGLRQVAERLDLRGREFGDLHAQLGQDLFRVLVLIAGHLAVDVAGDLRRFRPPSARRGEALEELVVDHVAVDAPDVAVQCDVLLILIEAGREDVRDAVFLPVHDLGLQGRRQLPPRDGRRRGARETHESLEHGAGHDADLHALHVLRCVDGSLAVREVAHAVVGDGEQPDASFLRSGRLNP